MDVTHEPAERDGTSYSRTSGARYYTAEYIKIPMVRWELSMHSRLAKEHGCSNVYEFVHITFTYVLTVFWRGKERPNGRCG
jgi:hypothetical protein